MPATIQVVLQQDVEKVGASGELVKVRPGYARNFLIPRKLAVPATSAAINRLNHEKAVAVAKADKLKKEARELAAQIDATKIQIAARVGEDGKLFGAITPKDIEAAVKAKGVHFDRKKMHLAEPIRQTGSFDIPVKLLADVVATLKLEVIAK
jgi:large subunit ribosomal protein L9